MKQIEIFISGASLLIAIIALIQTWRSTLKTQRLETFMQKSQILSDIKTFVYKHNYYSAVQDLLGFQPSNNKDSIPPQDLEDQILMCFGKELAQQFHEISDLMRETNQIDYELLILISTYKNNINDYQTLIQNLVFDDDIESERYLSKLEITFAQEQPGTSKRRFSYIELKKAQDKNKKEIEEKTDKLVKRIIERTSIA